MLIIYLDFYAENQLIQTINMMQNFRTKYGNFLEICKLLSKYLSCAEKS